MIINDGVGKQSAMLYNSAFAWVNRGETTKNLSQNSSSSDTCRIWRRNANHSTVLLRHCGVLSPTKGKHWSRSEAFTAVKIQVEVFWVVTPCSVVVGYQRVRTSDTLVSYRNTTWRHISEDLDLKHWSISNTDLQLRPDTLS